MTSRRTAGSRLHYAYYVLAVFELLTIGGALYLTHQLMTIFDRSVVENTAWQLRLRTYAGLDHSVLDLRVPLEDVFITEDPAGERRFFTAALDEFGRHVHAARQEAEAIAEPVRARILDDFDEVELAQRELTQQADRLFEIFNPDKPDPAMRMRTLAEEYLLALRNATVKLQDDAIASSVARLAEQEREASSLRVAETGIGVALALMVGAALLYGRHMSRQMRAAAAERERHLEALKASEHELRRTEARRQLAARATNDALWDLEVGTSTVWWNDAFAAQFPPEHQQPSMEVMRDLVHPDDRERIQRGMREFLTSGGDVWAAEYRMRLRAGGYAWVLDRGYAVRDPDGTARRMVSSMMNITERKEAERMKSDFVSFVSHQLRTPLSGMNWMLELASEAEDLPEMAREYITDARASATRLATLVNDLLDIARLESGRLVATPERLSLDTMTTAIAAEMQPMVAERGLALDVMSDADTSPVFADPQLLRQAITNLLSNAVKYTPRGGRIDVTLGSRNGVVKWAVRDTGVGVPRAAQARLFEKFYRAENAISLETEGTGLGLHLVRLIVDQAGGRVWCESEEGRGSTFAFTLPAMPSEKEEI